MSDYIVEIKIDYSAINSGRERAEEAILELLDAARSLALSHDCDEFLASKCIRFAKDGEF